MSAQTYGPYLLHLCKMWRRVWLMTSQVDVFADPFPDRHRLTLRYDVAVQGFDNAI